MNTCNLSTEDRYTNFFNYLICESIRLESQTKVEDHHGGGIELLPIVTRGCLCELANKIGFDKSLEKNYDFTNQVQTFKHIWGSDAGTTTKFIRSLYIQ